MALAVPRDVLNREGVGRIGRALVVAVNEFNVDEFEGLVGVRVLVLADVGHVAPVLIEQKSVSSGLIELSDVLT